REPVRSGENAAQVVRRMSPFRSEPCVVEVEPANHRADVEGGLYRIELVRRAGNFRAVGDDRFGDDWPEQLRAGWIRQRLEAAAERIEQAIVRGRVRLAARDGVSRHV